MGNSLGGAPWEDRGREFDDGSLVPAPAPAPTSRPTILRDQTEGSIHRGMQLRLA